ncbi:hypothetical protein [Pseudomarimonas arenosa]|uniref:Uncharacterized protein n=1 Tax=Pseudomarimonas arenosa TaxID=2774145 RepID=A0AAW3ZP18_9GAMM|nr:hypothetical protein [Pseudomarimonas arenosa]MBD8527895.1 hypothetical protein [Pseudomarimonas arenosa]
MLTRLIRLLCACLLSTTAYAHSELPSAEWCAQGRPIEVASFRLEEAAIRSQTDAVCDSEGKAAAKTCGQFDDDYSRTMSAARRFCGQFAAARLDGDFGSTSPLISGPRSFLSDTHHQRFRLRMGVEGICLRCEALAAPPVMAPRGD